MAFRGWSRWQRPWLIGTLVVGTGALVAPMVLGGAAVPLLVLALAGGFFVVPRFGRLLLAGALGGMMTGAVVLGGLLRVAMRVVALSDPVREPVLTSATVIIVLVGVFLGVVAGVVIAIVQRLWQPRPVAIAAVAGVVGIGLFLLAPDLRRELFEEGQGAVLNIPLFTAAFVAFGWSAALVVARLGRSATAEQPAAAVPAPA